MRVFLVGISCVGKTTIGAELAKLVDCPFFDLDDEIERFFNLSIEHLQEKFMTMHAFRQEASKALLHLLAREDSQKAVIALPPSGLMNDYWKIVKKSEGTIIVLTDDAVNIMKRIEFYDKDSNSITKHLSVEEQNYYLSEIKKDIIYYDQSYKRANISVSILGLEPEQAAKKVNEQLRAYTARRLC